MDAIEIEGIKYLVMRKADLDAIRVESFREGVHKQYTIDHHDGSNIVSGNVPNQCVMSNDAVVVIAHSDGGNRLMLDMKFDGLDDPVKLVLIVNDAYALKGVLNDFIECTELGGEHG